MLHAPLLDVVVSDRPAAHTSRLALEVRPQSAMLRNRGQVLEMGDVVNRWQLP